MPRGYEPNSLVVKKAYEIYRKDLLKITNDPNIAVLERMFFIQMFGHLWGKKIKR